MSKMSQMTDWAALGSGVTWSGLSSYFEQGSIIQKWQIGDRRGTHDKLDKILCFLEYTILFSFHSQMPTEILNYLHWSQMRDLPTPEQIQNVTTGHGTILVMGELWKMSWSQEGLGIYRNKVLGCTYVFLNSKNIFINVTVKKCAQNNVISLYLYVLIVLNDLKQPNFITCVYFKDIRF